MIFEHVWHDLRSAWRGLRHAPALSITAVLTLAVGMVGATGMFAVVYGVLLRPLPVRDQDRLLVAWKTLPSAGYAHFPFGGSDIETVSRTAQLLEQVAGVTANGVGRSVIVENGSSEYVRVALVTGAFFEVIGTRPSLGRTFTEYDDCDGAEPVLVISHGLWVRRYGSSPDVVGRRVRIDDRRFTVVGVMPPDTDYPHGAEVWRTTRSVPTDGPFGDAARQEVDLIARLRPGVTADQAASELQALTRRLEATAPVTTPRGLVAVVHPFADVVVGEVRVTVLSLFASVALVAFIASANVANLLLARGEARRSETAVRAALGAGRRRIVSEVLAESLLIALAAASLGLAVTRGTLQSLIALAPDGLPRIESVRIDLTVVSFCLVTSLAVALLAGLIPALSSTRSDLVSLLRSGGTGVTGSPVRRLRRGLVVVQIALAVTTAAAADLVIRSLIRLQAVDTGITADRLVFVDLALPPAKFADRARHAFFLDEVTSQLAAFPAVTAVTPVNVPPFSGERGWDLPRFAAEDQATDRAVRNPALNLESIHPSYFQTFGIPLVRGRAFARSDKEGTPLVAIVSEDVAMQTWPGEDAIGKRLKMGSPDSMGSWYTIVGVAAPTRYRDLRTSRPTLYLPAAQFQMTAQMLVLRTSASTDVLAPLARQVVRRVDQDVQVVRVAAFRELLAAPMARPRFITLLLGMFGGAAVLLASIGVYGVMAAAVRQRNREIAVRLALGATNGVVHRLILSDALRLGAAGALLGLACAWLSTRWLRGMLFGVHPLDPLSLAGAVILLLLVSALAALLPALSATRHVSIGALRGD